MLILALMALAAWTRSGWAVAVAVVALAVFGGWLPALSNQGNAYGPHGFAPVSAAATAAIAAAEGAGLLLLLRWRDRRAASRPRP